MPHLCLPRTRGGGAAALRVSSLGACSDLPRMEYAMINAREWKGWMKIARIAGHTLARLHTHSHRDFGLGQTMRLVHEYGQEHTLAVEYWRLAKQLRATE